MVKKSEETEPQSATEKLIIEWQRGSNGKEVAEKLGIKESSLHSRVAQLRKKGIPLKAMPRGRTGPVLDYDALAQLAFKLLPKDAQQDLAGVIDEAEKIEEAEIPATRKAVEQPKVIRRPGRPKKNT